MIDDIETWAKKWEIPKEALKELRATLVPTPVHTPVTWGTSNIPTETAIHTLVRLEASRKGCRLWRNNVGAAELPSGFIRWGLANESAMMNQNIKSSDLIGIRPVKITKEHVGKIIGQFLSREIKTPGWKYRATPHEIAQRRWIELINLLGGDASWAMGDGTL